MTNKRKDRLGASSSRPSKKFCGHEGIKSYRDAGPSKKMKPQPLVRTKSVGFKEDVTKFSQHEESISKLTNKLSEIFSGEVDREDVKGIFDNQEYLARMLWFDSEKKVDEKLDFSFVYNASKSPAFSSCLEKDSVQLYQFFKTKYDWVKCADQHRQKLPLPEIIDLVISDDFSSFNANVSGDVFNGFLHFVFKNIKDDSLLSILIDAWYNDNRHLAETDENDMTPLHIAAKEGNISAIKALSKHLNIGCDVLDNNGDTPLHIIVRKIASDTIECIVANNESMNDIEKKIDISVLKAWVDSKLPYGQQDKDGVLPVGLAQDCGLVEVTRLLNGDDTFAQSKMHIIDSYKKLILDYTQYVNNIHFSSQRLSEDNKFIKLLHYFVSRDDFKDNDASLGMLDLILALTSLKEKGKFIRTTEINVYCRDFKSYLTVEEYAKKKGYNNILGKINEHKRDIGIITNESADSSMGCPDEQESEYITLKDEDPRDLIILGGGEVAVVGGDGDIEINEITEVDDEVARYFSEF